MVFNKYYSVTIPCRDKLKNLVARCKNNQINFVDGIKELSSIGKIKKFNFNCQYVVLLPAASLFYHSAPLEEKNPYQISEETILSKFAEVKANFEDEFYYDYLEIASEQDQSREVKFFAAEKKMLDPITENLEKYKNNYLVSALPVAVFAVVNKLIKEDNYLLHYKIDESNTLMTVVDKKLDLLQSSITDQMLDTEIKETERYYLNNRDLSLKVMEGKSDLLNLDDYLDLKEDDFVFLTSLLWSVSKCQ